MQRDFNQLFLNLTAILEAVKNKKMETINLLWQLHYEYVFKTRIVYLADVISMKQPISISRLKEHTCIYTNFTWYSFRATHLIAYLFIGR